MDPFPTKFAVSAYLSILIKIQVNQVNDEHKHEVEPDKYRHRIR